MPMPRGVHTLVGFVSLTLLGLLPQPAAADVRVDPAEVAVTTGVLWILLGAGVLALWAAVALVWRLWRGSSTPRLKPRAVKILAGVIVLGWLASVVVVLAWPRGPRPSLAPAQAIGDIRTMISAQTAYQAENGGFFEGDPTCLNVPSRCLPGYGGPLFIDSTLAAPSVDKNGYRRTFHKGPAAPPEAIRRGRISPTSVESWAYTAVPLSPAVNGRAFCGDPSGVICATRDGRAPQIKDGRCVIASPAPPGTASAAALPSECHPLQ